MGQELPSTPGHVRRPTPDPQLASPRPHGDGVERAATGLRRRRHQEQRRALAHALTSIARGDEPTIAPVLRSVPSDVVDAVRYHRLAPVAHVLLRGAEPTLAALFEADRDQARALHLHVTTLVGHLGALFDGLPWAVYKGPVLSEVAHPVTGLRSYNDLDALVGPAHLRAASDRLLDAGWRIDDYDDMLRNPAVPGEMHWRSPSGIQLDLHWNIINTAERRHQIAVSSDELLERRVPITLGFSSGWTLDPIDGLIHVCVHGALTGANKLVYLVDAQRMAARVSDWSEVGQRAAAWGVAGHVALVLRRAQAALGGDLPHDLDQVLGTGRALRGLFAAVDSVAPVAHARTEAGIARLVARAVRPSAASTALAVVRSSVRYAVGKTPPALTGRVLADRRALETYLDRVEGAAACRG